MGEFTRYVPHPAQQLIHAASDRRFRIICTGRRFGKTLCLAADVLDRAHNDGGEYGWVAPTYNVAERGIEAIRSIAGDFVEISGRAPSVAKVPTADGGMAKVWFLSADNPDNIRGYGFKGLVVDEAASVPPDVWHYVLRPTIGQTLGWAVLISTPKARNWFFDQFTRGNDPAEKDCKSFRFPSIANPYFPQAEWEDAKRTLPSDVFKQEYQAEFLEDSAGVFRNIEACLLDHVPQPTGDIAIGCDLAKHTDWTVLIAMDRNTGACVDMDRFQRLDWPIQKDRILAFCRKWRGLLVMDATGAGDPIYDDLARVWPRIEAVKFTNQKKVELIQRLIVAVEQRQVAWPSVLAAQQSNTPSVHWSVLTNEMKRYEYAISPSGAITYSAPAGFHDDAVIALALAFVRGHARGAPGSMTPLPNTRPISALRLCGRILR